METDMFTQLNLLAVLVSAVAAFVLAFAWYMPPVFGLRWAALTKRYTGLSDSDLAANLPMKAGLWFMGFVVNAFVLAVLIGLTGTTDIGTGIGLGVMVALGIGAAMSSWPLIHARQPIGIWLMNTCLFLLQQIVMAVILLLGRQPTRPRANA
jgi:hypothetical protein